MEGEGENLQINGSGRGKKNLHPRPDHTYVLTIGINKDFSSSAKSYCATTKNYYELDYSVLCVTTLISTSRVKKIYLGNELY